MTEEPSFIIDGEGTKRWRLNGQLHREGGPAIEYAHGDNYWYLNGEYHNENGPAYTSNSGYRSYYLHNNHLSFIDWLKQTNNMNNKQYIIKELLLMMKFLSGRDPKLQTSITKLAELKQTLSYFKQENSAAKKLFPNEEPPFQWPELLTIRKALEKFKK